MGVLSEQMARDRKITRTQQDAFAAASFQKALRAQQDGLFDEEIAPLTVRWENPRTGAAEEITVARDDGVRAGVTVESLGRIRPAFAAAVADTPGATPTIHAGNASQVSDGAAAVLLMRRATAQRLGQRVLGKYVAAAVAGVPPLLMGIGPARAIPKLCERVGLEPARDVDVFEINEAFASQCVWCVDELGIPAAKVNPKGGAIALGHPLGCTGARQVSTLLTELRRRGERVGITSMCVGTGMGMAALWVAE
jgi:acetyl-CoA acyltransferase 1